MIPNPGDQKYTSREPMPAATAEAENVSRKRSRNAASMVVDQFVAGRLVGHGLICSSRRFYCCACWMWSQIAASWQQAVETQSPQGNSVTPIDERRLHHLDFAWPGICERIPDTDRCFVDQCAAKARGRHLDAPVLLPCSLMALLCWQTSKVADKQ